jgi:NAD(P)-dependent dehydrogenase (short-subunit alcohol dehydrogenase family)
MSSDGRIFSVSSDMHKPPGPQLHWPGAAALANPASGAVIRRRYSYSKLCNLYFTYELARRLRAAGSGLAAAAFNPGLMTETNFATIPSPIGAVMKRVFASRAGSLDTSSVALARLAESPNVAISGRYFDRTSTTDARSSDLSCNRENALELWHFSERLTGARY